MIRQSKKSDVEVMHRYLDLVGVKPNSYRLVEKMDMFMYRYLYCSHNVGTRSEQIKTVNQINNYDGVAVIYVNFNGNERVEDYVFLTSIDIYWDDSKESKRLKRLNKIIKKI